MKSHLRFAERLAALMDINLIFGHAHIDSDPIFYDFFLCIAEAHRTTIDLSVEVPPVSHHLISCCYVKDTIRRNKHSN